MATQSELERLLNKLFDERISADEEMRLEQLLSAEDGSARKKYFEYVDVHLVLAEQAELERATSADTIKPNSYVSSVRTPSRSFLWSGAFLLAAASIAAVVVMSGQFPGDVQDKPDVARADDEAPKQKSELPPQESADSNLPFVAEIGATSETISWAEDGRPREFLLRLGVGDSIELEEGVVAVEYFSGASLLLNGPCYFEVTGDSSGRLFRGSLTGQVSIGDFTLTTPTAEVVDLGTEFGASVDSAHNTDVFVFDGTVRLAAADRHGVRSDSTVLLSNGMAARTTRSGQLDTTIQIDQDRFLRSLPLPPSMEEMGSLSLVDIMNGYDEGGYRLASGIAPDTGGTYKVSLSEPSASRKSDKGIYHVTSWHPTIDGVFIPPRDGRNVQVDSTGGIASLPPSGATTFGPVWSRRKMTNPESTDFWGRGTLRRVLMRLQVCDWGMMGLHANVGVTFDLHAVKERFGQTPIRFRSIVANLDNSDDMRKTGHVDDTTERRFIADFRLFVDGKLRKSRLGFGRSDGDMLIETALDESDRFLTIVTSDAGHYWYDQVVLIDPLLELAPQEKSQSVAEAPDATP